MLSICDCNVLVNLDNLGWKEVYVPQWTLILIHWKGEQPCAPCVHIFVNHWCLCKCFKINLLRQALLKSFVCKHVCVSTCLWNTSFTLLLVRPANGPSSSHILLSNRVHQIWLKSRKEKKTGCEFHWIWQLLNINSLSIVKLFDFESLVQWLKPEGI